MILKQVDKRGNDYYAKKSGQIVLDGSELSVQDELYISGDVGYGTGHINFAWLHFKDYTGYIMF